MDYSKQVFARLSDTGMIVLPPDLSAEESDDCYRLLIEFADRANTDAELLRADLHSADAERIEKPAEAELPVAARDRPGLMGRLIRFENFPSRFPKDVHG